MKNSLNSSLIEDSNQLFAFARKAKPKRPSTIAEATASLQQNIDDLEHVAKVRSEAAEAKAAEIARLQLESSDDQRESTGAAKLAAKLQSFFFDDLDEEPAA